MHAKNAMDTEVPSANTQPFSCNELGPFQAILGDLLGPFSGKPRQFLAIFWQVWVILGNLGVAETKKNWN